MFPVKSPRQHWIADWMDLRLPYTIKYGKYLKQRTVLSCFAALLPVGSDNTKPHTLAGEIVMVVAVVVVC
jgi:hypothetical protein